MDRGATGQPASPRPLFFPLGFDISYEGRGTHNDKNAKDHHHIRDGPTFMCNTVSAVLLPLARQKLGIFIIWMVLYFLKETHSKPIFLSENPI